MTVDMWKETMNLLKAFQKAGFTVEDALKATVSIIDASNSRKEQEREDKREYARRRRAFLNSQKGNK